MARLRVHQLAKELGIDSKLILKEGERHGIQLKNHMSSLTESDEFMLRAFLEDLRKPAPKPAAETAPPPPPPPPPPPAPAPEPEAPVAPVRREEVRATPPGVAARPPAGRPAAPADPSVPERTARPATPREEIPSRVARPAARHEEPPSVPAVRAAPPGVTAAPPGVQARPAGSHPHVDAPEGITASPRRPDEAPEPRRASGPVRTATASPLRPGDDRIVNRTPTTPGVPRRQATILGRKELPPQQRRDGAPSVSRAGEGGSGLVATRREGGKRTFVNTGRGRGGPAGPGARGPGGPGFRGTGGRGGAGVTRGRRGRDDDRRGPGSRKRDLDPTQITPEELTVELPITVKGLSEKLGVKAQVILTTLFVQHKKMVKINDPLDKETVELLGLEYECEITVTEKADVETRVIEEFESKWDASSSDEEMVPRPPIVAFLGHVDHGKTSLLDTIRNTGTASREHGGITQHIGSSRVELPDGRAIALLDTPGHRAFTEMRARGAQVTDIVVLVVAADDGVMPQTKEAIAHARAAGTPIVVALNKCDKPEANPMKVRQELAGEGLQDESWGGETQIVEVSATTGQNIDQLLESILLEAEVLELKATPDRPATATVVEALQSKGEGNVARLMVNDGTLKKGDVFVCGTAYGRIRAIKGPNRTQLKEAGPSWPVEITGLNELPTAGDKLYVLDNLEDAKNIAAQRMQLAREKEIAKASHVSLESLFDKLKGDTLKIILKVDVTGSLEVLKNEIASLKHPEIRPDIIHAAVGGITETDVTLADASDAIILGFHVSADSAARRSADQAGVEIRLYHVIYKLTEELREALEGRLAPEEKEVDLGEAEVRATWKVSRLGVIAGCYVTNGIIRRDAKIRVARDGIIIHDEGRLSSLKRVKDDVKEVKERLECGMLIDGFDRIQVGDTVMAYEIQQIKRTFDSPPLKPKGQPKDTSENEDS